MGCSNQHHTHGYIHSAYSLSKVEIGKTNKNMTRKIMGSPSTIATIKGDSFYYISNTIKSRVFLKPKEIERNIIMIHFDEKNIVNDIKHYSLQDGKTIDIINRQTVTYGKKIGIIEQMFGNIGKFSNSENSDLSLPNSGIQ